MSIAPAAAPSSIQVTRDGLGMNALEWVSPIPILPSRLDLIGIVADFTPLSAIASVPAFVTAPLLSLNCTGETAGSYPVPPAPIDRTWSFEMTIPEIPLTTSEGRQFDQDFGAIALREPTTSNSNFPTDDGVELSAATIIAEAKRLAAALISEGEKTRDELITEGHRQARLAAAMETYDMYGLPQQIDRLRLERDSLIQGNEGGKAKLVEEVAELRESIKLLSRACNALKTMCDDRADDLDRARRAFEAASEALEKVDADFQSSNVILTQLAGAITELKESLETVQTAELLAQRTATGRFDRLWSIRSIRYGAWTGLMVVCGGVMVMGGHIMQGIIDPAQRSGWFRTFLEKVVTIVPHRAEWESGDLTSFLLRLSRDGSAGASAPLFATLIAWLAINAYRSYSRQSAMSSARKDQLDEISASIALVERLALLFQDVKTPGAAERVLKVERRSLLGRLLHLL